MKTVTSCWLVTSLLLTSFCVNLRASMNVLNTCRSLKCWGNRDSSLDWLAERVLARPDAYLLLQIMNTFVL